MTTEEVWKTRVNRLCALEEKITPDFDPHSPTFRRLIRANFAGQDHPTLEELEAYLREKYGNPMGIPTGEEDV